MIGLVLAVGCLFVVVLTLALCEGAAWEAEARRLLPELFDEDHPA